MSEEDDDCEKKKPKKRKKRTSLRNLNYKTPREVSFHNKSANGSEFKEITDCVEKGNKISD